MSNRRVTKAIWLWLLALRPGKGRGYEAHLEGRELEPESKPDVRSQYHNGAGSLSFADSHTELKKWRDSRTTPPQLTPTGSGYPPGVASPNNHDLSWLQDRSTRKTK
jgi:hypothetical protein